MSQPAERSIFLNALEEEDSQARESYLRTACGDDASLRASVEALLEAHERPANPLDDPIAGPPTPRMDESPVGRTPEGKSSFGSIDATSLESKVLESSDVGKTIGSYRLMEKIGEGGFGLVYVAQQEKPVRRKVALKIIKPGTGSKEILARFDAERQAVALMDHPHIAQVFDAGVTDDGRPYFVMELVRGVPVTDFCDQQDLGLNERLELFKDVCAATHHAHQKGVIHRDLKPANVLVTLHDSRPVVKVIDFGVAKAVGQNLTDQTLYTRFHSMIGTPLYMSPEQAAMSGLDVDTRSDIYSLGVLLYELLTGTTPFDRKRMDSAGFDELRRIIREEEPPRPSTRLTTVAGNDAATVQGDRMDQRTSKPRSIRGRDSIPSDLDWIVMKAMEKDRNRRYESAAAMAADLRRYLSQEPIEARPPSRGYRLAKFARRNRAALLTGSLVASALIMGLVASLYQASRATEERDQKDIALRKAVQAEADANAARLEVEKFTERLKQANSLVGEARAHESSQDYELALAAYDEAVALVPNYYLVWTDRAGLHTRLKSWEQAARDYSQALQLDAPVSIAQWQGVPALFLWTDRQDDYESLYGQMFDPDPDSIQKMGWNDLRACVFQPLRSSDAQLLAKRADELAATRFGGPRSSFGRPPAGPDDDGRFPRPDDNGPPPRGFDAGRVMDDVGRFFDSAAGRAFGGRRPRGDGNPNGGGPPFSRGGPNEPNSPGFGGRPRRPDGESRFGESRLPFGIQQYIASMAHLRAGNYERADEFVRRGLQDRGWPHRSVMHLISAISLHQQGKQAQATEALETAQREFEEAAQQSSNSFYQSRGGPWFDDVERLLLQREAETSIQDNP